LAFWVWQTLAALCIVRQRVGVAWYVAQGRDRKRHEVRRRAVGTVDRETSSEALEAAVRKRECCALKTRSVMVQTPCNGHCLASLTED